MQQVNTQEQVDYATLGWRFAAVLVDTLVLFGLLILAAMAYIVVLAAQGKLDLNDPAAVQALSADFQVSDWVANTIVFGGLFLYYAVLEAIFGASIGKLVFRMRVTMIDGSRPSGAAVVVRNLVRIMEAWLLYVPAGVSCLISGKKQRLGDHAARTVVVRRRQTVAAAAPAAAGAPAAPWAGTAPGEAFPPASPVPAAAAHPASVSSGSAEPSVDEALAGFKTAALAARGAHLNYLHFSELELSVAADGAPAADYSPEYVSAWYTLADAVAALRQARARADAAASRAGTTLEVAGGGQPDLLHLVRELGPYFAASSDEDVHEAYLLVARGDAHLA
jgi:uncharacterized RDD family membrane protein YckC